MLYFALPPEPPTLMISSLKGTESAIASSQKSAGAINSELRAGSDSLFSDSLFTEVAPPETITPTRSEPNWGNQTLDMPFLLAQSIIPAADGTGTIVTPEGNQITITGGQLSGDAANLFHSFSQFGLSTQQIANFLSSPPIQNILARVSGGEPSVIQGLIQVTGGNSNLFLMNPAGIVFGSTASLNVPAAFTATTATGLRLSGGWFSATGDNEFAALTGTPREFAFGVEQPGAIVNSGNLAVGQGQRLALLGGTVASPGSLTAPEGEILVTAVPGQNLVRLSQAGSPLSLEIEPIASQQPATWNLPIATLPDLLTGGNSGSASGITINSQGQAELTGSGLRVEVGDVTARTVTTGTATLSATRNLTLVESQLQTTGDLNLLAGNTLRVRDTGAAPFLAQTGGDLYLQGNQAIDILALNHPITPFQSQGDLSLVSDGVISGDAHFASGGAFNLRTVSGGLATFTSLYDPIISSAGNVDVAAAYTGQSLLVESQGNIRFQGAITITGPDISGSLPAGPDTTVLTTESALILRSGQTTLNYGGGNFGTPPAFTTGAIPTGITLQGGVTLSSPLPAAGGRVELLAATGDINIQDITTNGGIISLTSNNGAVQTGDLNTSQTSTAGGTIAAGSVTLTATGNVTTGNVDTFATNSSAAALTVEATAGGVTVNSGGAIVMGDVNSSSTATSTATSAGTITAQSGSVNLTSTGTTTTGSITSSANASSSSPTTTTATAGAVTVAAGTGIQSTAIDSSSSAIINSSGTVSSTGGAVDLSTTSVGGDISFTTIDTTAFASFFSTGDFSTSGTVDIAAVGRVQGTGAIAGNTINTESQTNNVSTFTTSVFNGAAIAIQHDGGPDNNPFVVGSATPNGTAGAINFNSNTGATVSPVTSFPVLASGGTASGTPAGITINSLNSAPSLTVTTSLTTTQDTPVTFTIGTTATVTDANSDNTQLFIDSIPAGGTLTRGGVTLVAGDPVSPGDSLTYTPPTGFTGSQVAFNLVAGDPNDGSFTGAFTVTASLSQSTPSSVPVQVNASPVPTVTPEPTPTVTPEPTPIPTPEPTPIPTPEPTPTPTPEDLIPPRDPPPPDPPEISRVDFRPSCGLSEGGYALAESKFKNEYEQYSGASAGPPTASADDACKLLADIFDATGVKPALIYISFVPQGNVVVPQSKLLSQENSPQPEVPNSENDQLELLMVTSQGTPVRKRIPQATRGDVMKMAQQFRQEVTNPESTDYLQPGQQLYQWLVSPLQTELETQEVNNLVFLLDTGLRSLPIAALHDGQNFIVEKYSVGLMPSLSLTNTRHVDIRDAEVLAMGASVFRDQNPLPAVPLELSAITQTIRQGEAFLNEAFTPVNLKVQRSQNRATIVHLATHSEFRPGAPANSYIQFWDRKLGLDEIRQLGLNSPPVELMVLSACRTALGDAEAELGFGGLAYQAGVKTVLASLWYVSDEGTLGLMTQFYQDLKSAPIKAEALREAQVAMLRGQVRLENDRLVTPGELGNVPLPADLVGQPDKALSHPYYWAAFTMIGNPW